MVVITEKFARFVLRKGKLLDFLVKPPFHPGVGADGAAVDFDSGFEDTVDEVPGSGHILRTIGGEVAISKNFAFSSLKVEAASLLDSRAEPFYGWEDEMAVSAHKNVVLAALSASPIDAYIGVELDQVLLNGYVEVLAGFSIALYQALTCGSAPHFAPVYEDGGRCEDSCCVEREVLKAGGGGEFIKD